MLVRERALYGTGFLPDTEQQIYRLPDDELFLAGTSEVALASLHDGEILEGEELPLRYAGFSPCFRREAGAAGKDTRGIFRVHQFDKVEMFSFVAPAESPAEHERILAIEEEILGELGLPTASSTSRSPSWAPRRQRSTTARRGFPARRATASSRPARTRPTTRRAASASARASARAPETPHTLNGTAVAVGRTIVALLENGQQRDGAVELPGCLLAYGAPQRLAPAP